MSDDNPLIRAWWRDETERDFAWRTGGRTRFIFRILLFFVCFGWWFGCFWLLLSIEKPFLSKQFIIDKLAIPNGIAATLLSVMPLVLYFCSQTFRRVVNTIIRVIVIGTLVLILTLVVLAVIIAKTQHNRPNANQTSAQTGHRAVDNQKKPKVH